MATESDFLNDALGRIGATRITAIDDGTPNANWCQVFYPNLRRGMLRSHHWNFAEDRATLAQDATTPAFEFAFSYTLPADLLKVKEYNGDKNITTIDPRMWYSVVGRYKIEGRKLLTNDSEVKIVYVKDVTNPDLWDALFYQALAAWLASLLASAIQHDPGKAERLMNQAAGLLMPLAMAVDGQEGTITPYVVDDLIWGR